MLLNSLASKSLIIRLTLASKLSSLSINLLTFSEDKVDAKSWYLGAAVRNSCASLTSTSHEVLHWCWKSLITVWFNPRSTMSALICCCYYVRYQMILILQIGTPWWNHTNVSFSAFLSAPGFHSRLHTLVVNLHSIDDENCFEGVNVWNYGRIVNGAIFVLQHFIMDEHFWYRALPLLAYTLQS